MINIPVSSVTLNERTSKKGNTYQVLVLSFNGQSVSIFLDSFALSNIQSILLANNQKGGNK